MRTNKELFRSSELEIWIRCAEHELLPQEKYLFAKYVHDKSAHILEAGTGGGRIAFNIESMGFNSIDAFDFVEEMIKNANIVAKVRNSKISFRVADAIDLSCYQDCTFNCAIYLQQIISFIPEIYMDKSIKEAYRILNSGGIALFSFLYWKGRLYNWPVSFLVNTARLLRREKLDRKRLPWMKVGEKPNFDFMKKNQSQVYWSDRKEMEDKLKKANFNIIESITDGEILKSKNSARGVLYIVCQK